MVRTTMYVSREWRVPAAINAELRLGSNAQEVEEVQPPSWICCEE